MHTSDDTSIYDKVVNAIFDEEMLSTKDNHENVGRTKLVGNDSSSIQYTEMDTETVIRLWRSVRKCSDIIVQSIWKLYPCNYLVIVCHSIGLS